MRSLRRGSGVAADVAFPRVWLLPARPTKQAAAVVASFEGGGARVSSAHTPSAAHVRGGRRGFSSSGAGVTVGSEDARLHAFFPAKPLAPAMSASEAPSDTSLEDVEQLPTLSFDNATIAFESKSTFELARTWLIFKICAIGPVVRHCDTLYSLSVRFFGSRFSHFALRHTFFNHFCAGETVADLMPRMTRLRKLGVGGILDYAAEAKDDAPPQAQSIVDETSTVGAPLSSRTYVYQGEAICDANTDIFLDAVRAVRDATPEGFAAIKLSGLGDPKLLERMSTCLEEMTRLFSRLSVGDDTVDAMQRQPFYCIDRSFVLDFKAFQKGWNRLFVAKSEDELRAMFNKLDSDGDGLVKYLEWSDKIKLSEINDLVRECRNQGPLYNSALDAEEIKLYENLVARTRKIMDLAQECGVRVMVDAEWMDIQPAIDHLVMSLQRTYNRGDRPIVFQTYQTYLKQMDARVKRDLQRSKNEGWRFGAKVVRGAYMTSEREKARTRGHESPVCETYEDTERNFHSAIDSILRNNAYLRCDSSNKAEALIATHNQGSIEYTLRLMKELELGPEGIYFGQLLGMADHVTFTLGANNFKAYKYVPYGPIEEVVPYLIRRTQENSAILGSPGVQAERGMVGKELLRRCFGA